MSNKVRSLVAEVLETGLDDWMPIFHVIDRASVLSGQERRLSGDIVMAALQIFVENDMLTAGYLGEFGFEAWGLEPRQALGRIRHECDAKEWDLGLRDIWLATTEKGDDVARLIEAEGEGVLARVEGFSFD